MYHKLFLDATFWTFLFSVDQDLAEVQRAESCPVCGGRLHSANYLRKPRGPRRLPKQQRYRLSFCCDRDGCRKRVTPPSVRFLGRKVFLGAVVVLVALLVVAGGVWLWAARRLGPEPMIALGSDRAAVGRSTRL